MHCPVIKEGVGSSFGELDEVQRQEEAADRMVGHCAYGIDGNGSSSSAALDRTDDGPVVYLVRRNALISVARNEDNILALQPCRSDFNSPIGRFYSIRQPIKVKADSAYHRNLGIRRCIHETKPLEQMLLSRPLIFFVYSFFPKK
jgi:hypothetical protein